MHAVRKRRDQFGYDTQEAKRQRGAEEIVRFQYLQAAAVNHPADNPRQLLLEEVRAVRAGLSNWRTRAHNLHVLSQRPKENLQLKPLFREQPAAGALPAAGGGGGTAAAGRVVAGALPPAGVFPGTCKDAHKLKTPQLTALQQFYGEDFGSGTVHQRRAAFLEFIST